MSFNVLDLFSGIGGFSLGLERTGGFRTVAFCEIEPRCREILSRHWPGVPVHGDVRTRELRRGEADIITGGFPCQDVSRAGKRAGVSGSRSGLFRELVRAIRMVGPKYAIMENVADLLHDGMGTVCGELADSGLRIEWDCIPAYTCGSPQERDRVWIVAYADEREQQNGSAPAVRRRRSITSKGEGLGASANANRQRELQPGWMFRHFWGRPLHRGSESSRWRENWRDRLSALCRVADGVSRRLDEAKPLGNAVLPQIPELIGEAILEAEEMMPVSDDIHAELVKENRRLRREISRLKDENRFLEDQMVARTRTHVETSRREAQRRAAAKFFDLASKD